MVQVPDRLDSIWSRPHLVVWRSCDAKPKSIRLLYFTVFNNTQWNFIYSNSNNSERIKKRPNLNRTANLTKKKLIRSLYNSIALNPPLTKFPVFFYWFSDALIRPNVVRYFLVSIQQQNIPLNTAPLKQKKKKSYVFSSEIFLNSFSSIHGVIEFDQVVYSTYSCFISIRNQPF